MKTEVKLPQYSQHSQIKTFFMNIILYTIVKICICIDYSERNLRNKRTNCVVHNVNCCYLVHS